MIEDIERASPGLIQLGAFTYGLFIDNIGYYIVFINTITEFINRFLKYGFFKPLFGTNIPLLGRGARPKGAKNCGLVKTNTISKSYGMPSGHSQLAFTTSTFIILKLYESYNVIGMILAGLASIWISYSRVKLNCHTPMQCILGSLIGILIGYTSYKIYILYV